MISHTHFVKLIQELFLDPILLYTACFNPTWSTDISTFRTVFINQENRQYQNGTCLWWHEEPINEKGFQDLMYSKSRETESDPHCHSIYSGFTAGITPILFDVNCIILANSEISDCKKNLLRKTNIFDWYFFFHGFLALDWFNDYKYLNYDADVSKVFITLNHLLTNKRSYRLQVLSEIYANNLQEHGYISAPLLDKNLVKKELFSPESYLSKAAKIQIAKNLYPSATNLILDDCKDYSQSSASIIDKKYSSGALWHLVTETVFYDSKLHLTEKIFKPIVTKRPFILIAAPGNLKYLKKYGFKTFSNWIDESYDTIENNDDRIKKIISELKKLCKLSPSQLKQMHLEMQGILNYNYNHFYGKFKEIIIDEMIDNFRKCIFLHNKDKSDRFRLLENQLDYIRIKDILMR